VAHIALASSIFFVSSEASVGGRPFSVTLSSNSLLLVAFELAAAKNSNLILRLLPPTLHVVDNSKENIFQSRKSWGFTGTSMAVYLPEILHVALSVEMTRLLYPPQYDI
jgi:hypothetical protein